jgi:P-type E1-E2 ATPase
VETEVASVILVFGDVVLLTPGSKVPADVRLIEAIDLKVDEAMLTDESIPMQKFTSTQDEDSLTPGDQRNIAFMGTEIVGGSGKGIVIESGSSTVLGRIARSLKEIRAPKSSAPA